MKLSASLPGIALALATSAALAADPPLRILPLGDSITQGSSRAASYRYPLWTKLVDEGSEVDFLGSERTVYGGQDPKWPDHRGKTFDSDHEGHWGWTTDEILAEDALPRWLEGYTPDIALVHLGTNDAAHGDSPKAIAERLEAIVRLLRSRNPRVGIVLAKLIPSTWDRRERNAALNGAVGDLESKLSTPESPVVVADQSAGFDPEVDTMDGIHPNGSGAEKMAARWLEGIHRVRKSREAAAKGVPQPGK